ncbi:MAG: carbohydrate ABC transporter substrate-binding protein [Clostridia bacterium]|nr:carbohydrate ABC transporter substrate-binding protein [Clostridia bacterium]
MLISKRILSAVLLGAMLCQLVACGSSEPVSEDTTTAGTDGTTAAEVVGYPYYSDTDFGGETFTIINVSKKFHSMLCDVFPDESNGETVNDAIVARNERVMEQLNCQIEEIHVGQSDINTMITQAVMSGDDVYDAAYPFMNQTATGIAEGYYYCLNDIDTVHLGESWWDPVMLKATSIGGKSYFATSSAHLMSLDGIWCLFFNEDMMDDLNLDYPYQTVRDGNWTLEEMRKYTKAAASLNGADSFSKEAGTSAVFGCTSFSGGTAKFLYGVGAQYFSKDKDDMPVFSADSERFANAVEKLASFMSTPGEYLLSDNETFPDTSYVGYFKNQNALFLAAEIKTAQTLRDMEQSFGIVPMPKADDEQENYMATCLTGVCVFTIPTTNPEPEKVGLFFDALSWESDATVLEPYFSVLVEQKGLRNEESIEMLEIIKANRSVDLGIAYSWASALEGRLSSEVFSTTPNIASTVASQKEAVNAAMNKTLEAIK